MLMSEINTVAEGHFFEIGYLDISLGQNHADDWAIITVPQKVGASGFGCFRW